MTLIARRHDEFLAAPDEQAELLVLTDALALWNVQSETSYISAGEDLQAIHGMLRAVEQAMARTISIMTGPEILAIDDRLGTAACLAERLENNGEAIAQRLAEVLAGHDHAACGNEQVGRTFSLLEYVALVGRTHAGSIGGRGGDLAAFLNQVTVLVGSGRKVARNMSDRLGDLHRSLDDAAQQMRERQQEEERSVPLLEVIAALTGELSSRRGSADENRVATRHAFAEIARSVAEVVSVLQFHDIARQRLDHVIGHLRLMFALIADEPLAQADGPTDAAERQAWITGIAQVEQAQLDDLIRLYQAKMALISGSLDSILDQARNGAALIGTTLRIDRAQLEEGGGMGIARQAEHLEERFLRREMRREAIVAMLADCIHAAGQFAAMTEALDDVEFSLRLAGFNAAIHAADRDSGDRTIGYIAHEIRDFATTAREGADLIRTGIRQTATAADELQAVLLPTEVSSSTAIRGEIGNVLAAIGAAEADCLSQLASAQAAAAKVPARVTRAKALMQGHVQGLALMKAVIETLATHASAPAPEADLSALSARLSADYTMREERAILASVLGESLSTKEPPAETAASHDLSDVFF